MEPFQPDLIGRKMTMELHVHSGFFEILGSDFISKCHGDPWGTCGTLGDQRSRTSRALNLMLEAITCKDGA